MKDCCASTGVSAVDQLDVPRSRTERGEPRLPRLSICCTPGEDAVLELSSEREENPAAEIDLQMPSTALASSLAEFEEAKEQPEATGLQKSLHEDPGAMTEGAREQERAGGRDLQTSPHADSGAVDVKEQPPKQEQLQEYSNDVLSPRNIPTSVSWQYGDWRHSVPSWAKPASCVELATNCCDIVPYADCVGPAVLWACGCSCCLWISFFVIGTFSINFSECTDGEGARIKPMFLYMYFPVIAMCSVLEIQAFRYTVIPRVQLLGKFHVLHCEVPVVVYVIVMSTISIFKRVDFLTDTMFMTELYMYIYCEPEEADAMYSTTWAFWYTKQGAILLTAAYFVRFFYAIFAAAPLTRCADMTPTKFWGLYSVASEPNNVVRTPSSAICRYRTLFNSRGTHRAALLVLAECCGMATVNLEDIKFAQALVKYKLRRKDIQVTRVDVLECLLDVRAQLTRGVLAIFLSGVFENCLQLNVQVLSLSRVYFTYGGDHSMKDPLIISITTSLVICVLKLREAIKAIQFAWTTRKWVQDAHLDLAPEAADSQGESLHLRRELNFIGFVFTPALVCLTLMFFAAIVWALVMLQRIHECEESAWRIDGCIHEDELADITD